MSWTPTSDGDTGTHTWANKIENALGNGYPTQLPSYVLSYNTAESEYEARYGLDGTIDASGANAATVLQAIVDLCEAAGGGTIAFKDASYTIATQITVTEPILFFFESRTGGQILCNVTDDYAFKVDAGHGTVFYNIYFNGNAKAGHGVKIDGASYCRIMQCNFYNFQTAIGIGGYTASSLCNTVAYNKIATVDNGVMFDATTDFSNDNEVLFNRINTIAAGGTAITLGMDAANANSGTYILKNSIENSGPAETGIKIGVRGYYSQVVGNRLEGWAKGIELDSSPPNLRIFSNNFQTNTADISGATGASCIIHDNIGFVTENGGVTAAIATGTAVNHGLAGTPTMVVVTAAETGPTDVYVDTVGAASFKINFGGGGNKTFYWQAEYEP